MWDEQDLRRLAHLNLVEFCRQATRWSGPQGRIYEGDGMMLFANAVDLPVLMNGAFALAPGIAAATLLERAHEWFGEMGRGFTVWADDSDAGREMVAAAEERGMAGLIDYPEMVVRQPVEERPLGPHTELCWVTDAPGMDAFATVSGSAYSTYGMDPESVRRSIADLGAFTEPHVQSVVAHVGGEAVAAAQAVLSHGIGGVFWVGTVEAARGKGLGDAVTRAVTNRAFERGARAVTLEASSMGEPIYRRMGYETIHRYRGFVRIP